MLKIIQRFMILGLMAICTQEAHAAFQIELPPPIPLPIPDIEPEVPEFLGTIQVRGHLHHQQDKSHSRDRRLLRVILLIGSEIDEQLFNGVELTTDQSTDFKTPKRTKRHDVNKDGITDYIFYFEVAGLLNEFDSAQDEVTLNLEVNYDDYIFDFATSVKVRKHEKKSKKHKKRK